jgi:hypothetical protein
MERPFPAYTGDEPYIFVSYAHEDAELVYPEIQWLKDQGFNIWYDEGISPGSEWHQELADRLDGSSLFLYFITPRSADSLHCEREVHYAIDNEMRLLAVHLEETQLPSGINLSLGNMQAIMRHELSEFDYRVKLIKGTSDHIQRGVASASVPSTAIIGVRPSIAAVIGPAGLVVGGIIVATAMWNPQPSEPIAEKPLKRFPIDVPDGFYVPPGTGQPLPFPGTVEKHLLEIGAHGPKRSDDVHCSES